jgi:hypothetical protein
VIGSSETEVRAEGERSAPPPPPPPLPTSGRSGAVLRALPSASRCCRVALARIQKRNYVKVGRAVGHHLPEQNKAELI